jgi:hypothetical protein
VSGPRAPRPLQLHIARVRDAAAETVRKIEDVVQGQYAAIYRDHPFLQPSGRASLIRRLLENPEVRTLLHLS